jgi:hypothetical protein
MSEQEEIDYSLVESKQPKKESKFKGPASAWIECYISQTPPSLEDCKKHFAITGLTITKREYDTACKKLGVK